MKRQPRFPSTGSPALLTLLAGTLAVGLALAGLGLHRLHSADTDLPLDQRRAKAAALQQDGNFAEAYDLFQTVLLDENHAGDDLANDLEQALACLQRLGRMGEVDDIIEQTVTLHADDWLLLWRAANLLPRQPSSGSIVDGVFRRADHSGTILDHSEHDRVRALQLFLQAEAAMPDNAPAARQGEFYLNFADMVNRPTQGMGMHHGGMRGMRGHWGMPAAPQPAWRWQILTDIETLPDPLNPRVHGRGGQGLPVDEDGEPVFFAMPESWDDAENDGQRWRWLMHRAAETDPDRADRVALTIADTWRSFYDVSTLGGDFGSWWQRVDDEQDQQRRDSIVTLHTLTEQETICRLATGIRRFELPDEFRFIPSYRELLDSHDAGVSADAHDRLARLFTDRRQYATAADTWRQAIQRHGPGDHNHRRDALRQIVNNLGRFDGTMTQPAGEAARFGFVFRNAEQARFRARPIDIEGLIQAADDYLASNPQEFDHERIQLEQLGHYLVQQQRQSQQGRHVRRFLGDASHQWQLDLEPADHHWDRRIVVESPLDEPGAWLVEAELDDGNVSTLLVWIADTVLIRKPAADGNLYLLQDAVDGSPVADADISLLGFEFIQFDRQQGRPLQRGQRRTELRRQQLTSDQQGIAFHSLRGEGAHDANLQWMAVARTDDGRLAHLGFNRVWAGAQRTTPDRMQRGYLVTDRPVYKPGQDLFIKAWLRTSGYGEGDAEPLADTAFTLTLRDPQGNEVWQTNLTTNRHGGADTSFELPDDAMLGIWHASIQRPNMSHNLQFRVEEYRTPEFEVVVDAPEHPITLGDAFEATVTATYYAGGPVQQGTVSYKIERHRHSDVWFPPMPWDWLYGRGYGWLLPIAEWRPGFDRWGIRPPPPPWIPWSPEPPELVAENEVEIGADGTITIEIDSSEALELHGDSDHRYHISVEVTDASRRVIVGSGEVIAARQPFQVLVSPQRGFYQTGDRAVFHLHARTPDGKPVEGEGVLRLLRQSYDADGNPQDEEEVERIEFQADGDHGAEVDLVMAQAGQFRVAATVTTEDGVEQEGAVLLLVREAGFTADGFRFNDLELIPEQAEYAPGDTVRLMINTDLENATVALFVRPENGTYERPEILTLDGKSTVFEFELTDRDQPNLFVEVVTVSDAKVHTVNREIAVPPVERVLNLEIIPTDEQVQPGSEMELTLRLTDAEGRPFVGETALAVYDRAIDYIAGGLAPPDIREHFWGWKRHHAPAEIHSLSRPTGNVHPANTQPWSALGMFGSTAADDEMVMFGRGGGGGGAPGAMLRSNRQMAVAEMAGADMLMDAAPPAPMAAMVGQAAADGGPAEAEFTVRSEFADLAFWTGSLVTGEDGTATVSFQVPDNLTTWTIGAWGIGEGTAVGHGSSQFVASKKLRVRPQLPRFLTQTDRIVLSAVVHNDHDVAQTVRCATEIEGGVVSFIDAADAEQSIEIPAGGEHRFDFEVLASAEGTALVRMKALAELESDAAELSFPVHVHGMLKTEAWSGVVRPDDEHGLVTLTIPQQRRPEQSRLEIRWSPSIAGALVDALPYLAHAPRGSTDQTLNRFLPTVVTHRVLIDLGLDLNDIREQRVNLNPQELGDPAERAAQWGWDRNREPSNPVFSEAEVARLTREGVAALTEMQLRDGGWGWFSGFGERSTPHTTATVVRGLRLAQANGANVDAQALESGTRWLERYEADQVRRMQLPEDHRNHKRRPDAADALVHLTLVEAGQGRVEMRARLYQDRLDLPHSAQAMTGLACALVNENERRDMIVRNLGQFTVRDAENQTAYLDLRDIGHSRWFWWGDEIETNSHYLKLLALTDPQGEDAAGLAKFLLNNRKNAGYWKSSRDTALAIEALSLFMRLSGEAEVDLEFDLLIDGEIARTVTITPDNLFRSPNRFVLEGDDLAAGERRVEFRRRGTSPLYFNVYSTNFTLEDFITATGLEVKVERQFYKLEEVDVENLVAGQRGQVVEQAGKSYLRHQLESGAELQSGDLVEVELRIESKNDYEYLMFEDLKAAGLEPVDVRSGHVGNGRLHAYLQLRDRQAAFYVRDLPRGEHTLRYRLRAEAPGSFSALPAVAQGVYAPELRANSDEIKLQVRDRD